jgi:1,4-alpha-glucan branching enzyme
MGGIAGALWMHGFGGKWRGVQYVESHDEVYRDRGQRIARLGDASNSRSWYARSRARVAAGIVLSAPGIPMLFMGQEFLEDKQWADDPSHHPDLLLYWDGLAGDQHMRDHLRFVSDLVRLRRGLAALRGDGLRVIVADDYNRVLAFQRWVEGAGQDVVVVVSLNDATLHGYRVGMPWVGPWRELFNSDAYDFFPNPLVAGNGGTLSAFATSCHGMPAAADLTIPANGVLVLAGG